MQYPTRKLNSGEVCRTLQPGEAFKCPWCGGPMRPHDGPWAVTHCVPCQQSVDLWYDEPQVMQAEVESYKPDLVAVDPETREAVDLEDTWVRNQEENVEPTEGKKEKEPPLKVDVASGPLVTKAKVSMVQNVKVVMCIPFPSGTPACAQCGAAEITHAVVYEVQVAGRTNPAFGCVCSGCASGIETLLEAGEN